MRLVLRLAIPVGLLIGAAGTTILFQIAHGMSYCDTWLSVIAPYCP